MKKLDINLPELWEKSQLFGDERFFEVFVQEEVSNHIAYAETPKDLAELQGELDEFYSKLIDFKKEKDFYMDKANSYDTARKRVAYILGGNEKNETAK